MSVTGTVYLTDGFERLRLPGRRSIFKLEDDWIAHGTMCSWIWPFEQPANVAGAEVELDGHSDGATTVIINVGDLDGPPEIVQYGQEINFTPSVYIYLDFDKAETYR